MSNEPRVSSRQHLPPLAARAVRGALGALDGLLAGLAALGCAEAVSAAVRPQASPVVAVGGAAIDRTPAVVKDFAVRRFGTDDKLVLQLGILAVLALFAVGLGLLALRHRRTASAGVLVFGLVGSLAAAGRPDAGGTDWVPSVAGALAGAGTLYLLTGRMRATAAGTGGEQPGHGAGAVAGATPGTATDREMDRRGFALAAGAVALGSTGAGLLGRRLNSAASAGAAASRAAITLPAPGSPAPAVPRGAGLRIPGLSGFITPNRTFYRVDTALVVPAVDARDWRLRIHGKGVTRPLTLTYQDLLDSDLIERDITLTCVSNQVGGPYAGNARWLGVPLARLLKRAGVRPPSRGGPADQLVARSVDGMTLGTPVETVMDGRDAILALGMNGEPLPFAHGFPVRMVVPGLYGYVSACKWLADLELTTFGSYDAYWVKRGWARRAPVKTGSRIDTPKPFARPEAGTVPVAGVAWAQQRGIDRVEVRVDGGAWQTARLAAEDSTDTWRQWLWEWPARPGVHRLEVRATDRDGYIQTDRRTGTVPDGATGLHSVVVTVAAG